MTSPLHKFPGGPAHGQAVGGSGRSSNPLRVADNYMQDFQHARIVTRRLFELKTEISDRNFRPWEVDRPGRAILVTLGNAGDCWRCPREHEIRGSKICAKSRQSIFR